MRRCSSSSAGSRTGTAAAAGSCSGSPSSPRPPRRAAPPPAWRCWSPSASSRPAAPELGGVVVHCLRHHNPLVDPALFRIRAFSGASVVATIFSMAFGAMLLSIVLWEQDVWGWSALRTGLSIAPGPFMVPVFSFLVTGRAIARLGAATVSAVGSAIFAVGVAWWALAIGLQPDYSGSVLGGMILTGARVGPTLPPLLSPPPPPLPPPPF